jgi:hypothetical protein
MSAFFSGIFGRFLGVKGSQFITCINIIFSFILGLLAFYEVGLNNSFININIGNWLNLIGLDISWAFLIDSLTVSMFLPVLTISMCVHIYSIGYMEADPHIQRFFSYLSLFTFFMLILITGENFLILFIGWEGIILYPKWLNTNIIIFSILNIFILFIKNINKIFKRYYFIPKLRSFNRIGPHEKKTIMILIASLLGDGHLNKGILGSRFQFEQSNKNVEYLMRFHKYFSIRGYCSTKKPKLLKRIHKNGNIHFSYQFKTYYFSSFNWIHEIFYDSNNKKILPKEIENYLTPYVLSIWFMDDGCSIGGGYQLKISSQSFTLNENLILCNILNKKYNLKLKVQSRGLNKGYIIIINAYSAKIWANLIKPYMLESMYYKLGKYNNINV